MGMPHEHQRVLGITPFAEPHAHLAAALARAGALSVLDLGRDAGHATRALADLTGWWSGAFGVRVGAACPITPADLPSAAGTVVLAGDANWTIAEVTDRTVIVEVVSLPEARAAVTAGADALIVRGAESGGRVGTASTFVLLQEILGADLRADDGSPIPVWAAGGIGPHTAAAAVAGGAHGVVLDTQLSLTTEVDLPARVATAVRRMDGTETEVVGGYRIYVRPDLTRPEPMGIGARVGADLAALPVGEDAALAAALADKHRTAAGIVAAITQAIRTGVITAAGQAAAGRRPRIAQGPMTRVSDQAAFAKAVADAGGLPFIALALMGADDSRALLEETAELLGDAPVGRRHPGLRPGGPARGTVRRRARRAPAVRADRRRAAGPGRSRWRRPASRPSCTCPPPPCWSATSPRARAGSCSRARNAAATSGRAPPSRCGNASCRHCATWATGSAAPRSSTSSSPAASTTPARRRWSPRPPRRWWPRAPQAGVLMGTAYLFTREAVTAGAIGPAFQRAAMACDSTVLLTTAPGHATRCADSEFVATFNATRERLIAEGMPLEEVWAELEKLNIGRLRIASKGIRREGGALIPVDERTQARDGMVMIGDVARLRSAVTTVADLHHDVDRGRRRVPGRAGEHAARAGRPRHLRRTRWTSRSSAWPACSRTPVTSPSSGRTSCATTTRSPRSRPAAGIPPPTSTVTGGRAAPRSGAASCPTSRSTPCATASRRRRWPASSRCSCSRSRWPPAPCATPATTSEHRRTAARSTGSAPPWSSAPSPAPTSRPPTGSGRCTRSCTVSCRPSSTSSCPS